MARRGESRIEEYDKQQWDSLQLSHLMEWHELWGRCKLCARREKLNFKQLNRRFGEKAKLVDIQDKLRCTGCRNRIANEIVVTRMPRD